MVILTLNGVSVDFPYEPYELQKDYMSKVIECLQRGVNGLLESPTGTGKTLSLLCSSLAWLTTAKAQVQAAQLCTQDSTTAIGLKSQLQSGTGVMFDTLGPSIATPKIIYASRTHSQLSQVLQELKRTSYGYIKACILGSRDQLCIHPEVSKEQNNSVKLHMCHARVAARSCFFHTNLDAKKEDRDFKENILDIEDLVSLGKKHSACPYFMTREIRKNADIIFMPYNYLLDPKIRRMHNIELQGNIIIFDEAHNVEKMCEESASIQLRTVDVVLCIDEVTQIMKKFRDTETEVVASFGATSSTVPQDFTLDDLCVLKAMFLELEKALDGVVIAKEEGVTLPGEFMLELLAKADITPGKKELILKLVERVVQYLTVSSTSPFQRKGAGLQKFADLIKIVFSKDNFNLEHISRVKQSYKTHIQVEQNKGKAKADSWSALTKSSKGGRVLSYWCFSPGFGMRDLVEQGVRSIILTSGTLSPLNSFAAELQVPFPITLENPHIIQNSQVLVGVINNGPDGTLLDSSYKNRDNEKYIQALGRTIRSVAQVVPYGLLVFFPSYPVMKTCHESWQASGIWDGLQQTKPIFVEPTSKEGFQAAMSGFYSAISDGRRGACFMAVCRGKVSEGLDFADHNGRAVIITGLPYPPSRDPRVLEKQKYLDVNKRNPQSHGLTGQEWYRLEATRAVNQAIGRVIRHKSDYGAILLCDHRFGNRDLVNQLSSWVRTRVHKYDKLGPLLGDLGKFYRNADVQYPVTDQRSKQPLRISSTEPGESKITTRPISSTHHALKSDPTRLLASYCDRSAPSNRENFAEPDLTGYASQGKIETIERKSAKDMFSQQSEDVIDFNDVSQDRVKKEVDPAEEQPVKRRKIAVVSEAEKLRRMKAAAEGQRKSSSAADYLKRVREVTDPETYARFARLIRTYQNDRNAGNMFAGIKQLVEQHAEHKQLFKDFRPFVPKENVDKFEEIFR